MEDLFCISLMYKSKSSLVMNEPLGAEIVASTGVVTTGVTCITGLSFAIYGAACADEGPLNLNSCVSYF